MIAPGVKRAPRFHWGGEPKGRLQTVSSFSPKYPPPPCCQFPIVEKWNCEFGSSLFLALRLEIWNCEFHSEFSTPPVKKGFFGGIVGGIPFSNPWALVWDPNLMRAENAPIHIVTAMALESLNHGLEPRTIWPVQQTLYILQDEHLWLGLLNERQDAWKSSRPWLSLSPSPFPALDHEYEGMTTV